MTEDEAKKILDFLIKRFQRHPSTVDVAVKRITKRFNDALIVEYEYTKPNEMWSEYHHSWVPEYHHSWAFLWACESCGRSSVPDHTLALDRKPTAKNIIEFLFKIAKTDNVVVSLNSFCPLISKGESLEEIRIKADLEDING